MHGPIRFPCVFPVIDHEFRPNVVKVAVDPPGDIAEVAVDQSCCCQSYEAVNP